MPSRTRPTRFLTGGCRCDVPSREVPVSASARSASTRTLEGPAPKRPAAGLRWSGMVMVSVTVAATSDLGCECLTSLSASVRVPAYSGTRDGADDERGHMTSDVRTAAHRGRRTALRVVGVVGGAAMFAGLLLALLGLADLFRATATDARFCDGCGASVA